MSDQLLWTRDQGLALTGCGERALLDGPLTAFFSSRQCPGGAIRAAMDWALEQARGRLTEELATQRNEWVASLASQIVVAHASPGGQLAVLCDEWSQAGRSVRRLG